VNHPGACGATPPRRGIRNPHRKWNSNMQVLISGHSYMFSDKILSSQNTHDGYFLLAKTIFRRLDFDKWYRSGYWDERFIPYVLYDGDTAVSSVGVCLNDVIWKGETKLYAQLSTVMTLPEYEGRGLNRWLMERVINEWRDKCDAIYLLSNDSVVDYYPKFGFDEFTEYDFTMPIIKTDGEYRKLNIEYAADLNLIKAKYEISNPFAEIKVKNYSQFMFHCMFFVAEDIYYIEKYDAVAIVRHDGKKMICCDVFTDKSCQLGDILGVMANGETEYAYLGFTPKSLAGCTAVESQEEDNHLFVLSGKENIFKDNKVMFPLLSRA